MKERPILFSGPMGRALLDGSKTQTRRVMKPQPVSNTISIDRQTGNIRCINDYYPPSATLWRGGWLGGDAGEIEYNPYGLPGEKLWVREAWTADFNQSFSDNPGAWWHEVPRSLRTQKAVQYLYYKADDGVYHAPQDSDEVDTVHHFSPEVRRSTWTPEAEDLEGRRWVPSIHMPRWASRITLEITEVRVERVQSITEADAIAEGFRARPEVSDDPEVHRDAARDWYSDLWNELNMSRGFGWAGNPYVWCLSFKRVHA